MSSLTRCCGWAVQDYKDAGFTAGLGVAVSEVPTATDPMDYLLAAHDAAQALLSP